MSIYTEVTMPKSKPTEKPRTLGVLGFVLGAVFLFGGLILIAETELSDVNSSDQSGL